jgi:hypothetical protein
VVPPPYTRVGLLTPVDQVGILVDKDDDTDQQTDPVGLTVSAQADLSPTGLSAPSANTDPSSGHPVRVTTLDRESCGVRQRPALLDDHLVDSFDSETRAADPRPGLDGKTRRADGSAQDHQSESQTASDQPCVPDHLQALYEASADGFTEGQQQEFAAFLWDYQNVFAKSADDLGRTSLVQHRIDTGTSCPIKLPPRKVPMHTRQVVQQEVEKMLVAL